MKIFGPKDLRSILQGETIRGNLTLTFSAPQSLENATQAAISWIKKPCPDKDVLSQTKASHLVLDERAELTPELLQSKCFILSSNPRLTFSRIVDVLFYSPPVPSIHPQTIIHPQAAIHETVFVGPNCHLGHCSIGKHTQIRSNAHVGDNVSIGNNVIIEPGAVIGTDGFGYSRNEKNEFVHFPHIGGVIIEDDVYIGANACIDRGSLGDTIIKQGAKIDNLVHIAHNVIVGKHTAVIALAMLGGSVQTGNYSWIAPSASVMNQAKLGENVTVGLGSTVMKNVLDGQTVIGTPARPIKEFVKIQRELEKRMDP